MPAAHQEADFVVDVEAVADAADVVDSVRSFSSLSGDHKLTHRAQISVVVDVVEEAVHEVEEEGSVVRRTMHQRLKPRDGPAVLMPRLRKHGEPMHLRLPWRMLRKPHP